MPLISEESARNANKYGIDFDAAQALWDENYLLVMKAATVDEERFLAIGKIETQHWTVVQTFRNAIVYLTSTSRSRKKEVGYDEGA